MITAGYHGLIYADRDTKNVMRITMFADDIPADFPVQEVNLDLNYDITSISGQEFLLPLKSELHSKDGRYLTRNETEFRNYNKYGSVWRRPPEGLLDDSASRNLHCTLLSEAQFVGPSTVRVKHSLPLHV